VIGKSGKKGAAWVPFPVLSAVLGAAIRRSLERKSLIFLGLGFFFEPEGRGFESLPARHLYSNRKARTSVNASAVADST